MFNIVGDHLRNLEFSSSRTTSLGLKGLSVEADNGVSGSDSEASTHPFLTSDSDEGLVTTSFNGDLVTIRVGLDGSSNLHDGVSGPGGGGGTDEGNVESLGAVLGSGGGTSTHSNSGHYDYVERKRKIIL